MKKELQDKLFEKYPKIFRQKDLPKQQTAMCWGISCGDGWYEIIDMLCGCLQQHAKNSGKIIEAVQVKSKFGSLRFYAEGTGVDDFTRGLIRMAESISKQTKEWTDKEKFYKSTTDKSRRSSLPGELKI